MAKKNIIVQQIAQILAKNASYFKENGINGKLGTSLFLFQYARLTDKSYYRDLAFDILDYAINKELLLDIQKTKIDFLNGVSGIGLFIMCMIKEQYFESDLDEIATIIDKRIYFEVESITRSNEKTVLSTLLSMLAYLKYRKNYSRFSNEYDKLLNEEAILLIEISIYRLITCQKYNPLFLFSTLQLIREFILIENDIHLDRIDKYLVEVTKNYTKSKNKISSSKKDTEYEILSTYFDLFNNNMTKLDNESITFSKILKNQISTSDSFRNLTSLGLLQIKENNTLMKLFWKFKHLDYNAINP